VLGVVRRGAARGRAAAAQHEEANAPVDPHQRCVVQAHGGRIDAANLPRGGACFTAVLPRAN
jgi:hypothetical protein